MRRVTYSGRIKGLNDKECGQIGVKRIPGTCKRQLDIRNHSEMAVCTSNAEPLEEDLCNNPSVKTEICQINAM